MRRLLAITFTSWFLACDLAGDPSDSMTATNLSPGSPVAQESRTTKCGGLHYGNTAKPLAERYCLRCHRTPLVVRPGEFAPTGLDDEPSWLEHGGHALELLRAGAMPLTPPRPAPDEILRLTKWLECENANRPHGHGEASSVDVPAASAPPESSPMGS